jgi:Uma2 family endonuclease
MGRVFKTPILSLEDYLEGEKTSEVKHEFVDGQVFAMTGASIAHNLISLNFARHLYDTARAKGCTVVSGEVKVQIKNAVFYPDVMVVCSNSDNDPYVMKTPCLLVEVQSPSTARFDYEVKLQRYRQIASLKAYLIVSQERRKVDVFRRAGELWTLQTFEDAGSIALECPDTTLSLDQIYEGLNLVGEDQNELSV